jgi:hypothetical protein
MKNSNMGQGLRSFTDLTEHLKARADDNHAAPVTVGSLRHSDVSAGFNRDVKPG